MILVGRKVSVLQADDVESYKSMLLLEGHWVMTMTSSELLPTEFETQPEADRNRRSY